MGFDPRNIPGALLGFAVFAFMWGVIIYKWYELIKTKNPDKVDKAFNICSSFIVTLIPLVITIAILVGIYKESTKNSGVVGTSLAQTGPNPLGNAPVNQPVVANVAPKAGPLPISQK